MLIFLSQLLHANPYLVFFLVLGLGYLIGKVKIRGFEFGPVAGVLFVGLIFGHYGYGGETPAQSIGFMMFIFSVGLQAGPRFFSVLMQDGFRYFILAVTIASTGFLVAMAMSRLFGFEPGLSAGLLAGGLTSSPTLAAAQDAVRAGNIHLPAGYPVERIITNVSTGYAITYIFGLAGLLIIIRLLPRIGGINLVEEAAKLAVEKGDDPSADASRRIVTRAYEITRNDLTGIPLSELYSRNEPGDVTVHKLKRDGALIEITPTTEFRIGDLVSFTGSLDRVKRAPERIGPEITDTDLLASPTETCRIVVTKSRAVGMEVNKQLFARDYGCLLTRVSRLGVDVPIGPLLVLERSDVLTFTGPKVKIERLGEMLGHLEREIDETDLLTVALGIAAGIVVGTLSVSIAGISVGLGSAGGLLVAGLTIGFLRSIHPTFGRVPSAARWLFMELGLLFFMAGIGLRAGRGIMEALLAAGPKLFLSGVLVTTTPVIVGYLLGRFVLKINPVLLMGGITGSMTSGACLSIVNREAQSTIPSLGYTGAYAFANVLLTVAGSVILLF